MVPSRVRTSAVAPSIAARSLGHRRRVVTQFAAAATRFRTVHGCLPCEIVELSMIRPKIPLEKGPKNCGFSGVDNSC